MSQEQIEYIQGKLRALSKKRGDSYTAHWQLMGAVGALGKLINEFYDHFKGSEVLENIEVRRFFVKCADEKIAKAKKAMRHLSDMKSTQEIINDMTNDIESLAAGKGLSAEIKDSKVAIADGLMQSVKIGAEATENKLNAEGDQNDPSKKVIVGIPTAQKKKNSGLSVLANRRKQNPELENKIDAESKKEQAALNKKTKKAVKPKKNKAVSKKVKSSIKGK